MGNYLRKYPNIEFLTKQLEKALEDIEELKDSNRDMHYKNGNGG